MFKDCRKRFYREERHTYYQWNRIAFHSRECQTDMYNKKRRGKRKNYYANTMNLQGLHDACNRYTTKAREKLKKQMVVYSHENMTQEELREVVPSMRR